MAAYEPKNRSQAPWILLLKKSSKHAQRKKRGPGEYQGGSEGPQYPKTPKPRKKEMSIKTVI